MDFTDHAGSSQNFQQAAFESSRGANRSYPTRHNGSEFEIFEWYPHYQNCHRFFLDHAQHSEIVQAVATFINITLPYQKQPHPVMSSSNTSSPHSMHSTHSGGPSLGMPHPIRSTHSSFSASQSSGNAQAVSVIPYLRRLIATGFDNPGVLHGFFGDRWVEGIGPLHEVERRNYLFAAKSANWLKVKADYDMSPNETVPFLKPLQRATEAEISTAEKEWSDWLAMQDWMVGPRAPDAMDEGSALRSPRIKNEPRG